MWFGWRQFSGGPWSPLGAARRVALLSQAELAAIVGTTRETISSIERGKSIPSVTLALAISRAVGVTVEELFAGDELR